MPTSKNNMKMLQLGKVFCLMFLFQDRFNRTTLHLQFFMSYTSRNKLIFHFFQTSSYICFCSTILPMWPTQFDFLFALILMNEGPLFFYHPQYLVHCSPCSSFELLYSSSTDTLETLGRSLLLSTSVICVRLHCTKYLGILLF